jgi:hypothetical protein
MSPGQLGRAAGRALEDRVKLRCIVLLLLVPAVALAAPIARPCALLNTVGIAPLVGPTNAQPTENQVEFKKGESGNDHDGYIAICTWVAGPRKVTLTVGTTPVTPEGRAHGKAQAEAARTNLVAMGGKSSKAKIGAYECSTVTWPPSMAKFMGAVVSTCAGESGPLYFQLSVTASAAGDLVAPEKIVPVADKIKAKL